MIKSFLHVSNLMPGRDGISAYLDYFKSAIGPQAKHYGFPRDYSKRQHFTSHSLLYVLLLARVLFSIPESTLIVGHSFPGILFLVLFKKLFFWRDLKLLLVEHRSSNNRRRNRFFWLLDRWIYRHADLTICASHCAQRQLMQWLQSHKGLGGLSPYEARIKAVYTGVVKELEPTPPVEKDWGRTLVFLGRLEAEKGPELLLRMARLLPGAVDRLIFIGEGSLRPELEREAKQLKGVRCLFLGNVPQPWEQVPLASVVIIPSLTEGFCLVAAEAFARGKPVIASDVEALRELVSGRGYLAEVSQAESFAQRWHECFEAIDETRHRVDQAYVFSQSLLTLAAMNAGYQKAFREAGLGRVESEGDDIIPSQSAWLESRLKN